MAINVETILLATFVVVMTIAFLGLAPAAEATHNANLFVSADNSRFGNHFGGPQVTEVVVNDPVISETDRGQAEPSVTVNGNDLRMVQAVDGNWYGYFADRNHASSADQTVTVPGQGLDFGNIPTTVPAMFDDADGIAHGDNLNVVREAKQINSFNRGQISLPSSVTWPVIQLYDFNSAGNVLVQYNKAGAVQSTTLTFDTVDDYAGVVLDRSSYQPGSQIRATITDPWLNIDPTDEDSWTFSTAGDGMTHYQAYDENGSRQRTSVDDRLTRSLDDLMCDDNCVMKIDVDASSSGTSVITFQDNSNSRAVMDFVGRIPQPVTITERGPNSGVFVTYDDSDLSTIKISDNARAGTSATLDYNDTATTVLVADGSGDDLADALRELRAIISTLTAKVTSLEATVASLTTRVAALEGNSPPPMQNVTIEPAPGSGVPGCENTSDGCFIPKRATVNVGGTVTFSNTDTVAHTFTSGNPDDGHNGIFDSVLAIPGASYVWTPNTAGIFQYWCIIHPWRTGTIIVQEGGSGPTVPGMPTDLKATSLPAGIALEWTLPPDGGAAITNHKIRFGTSPNGPSWTEDVLGGKALVTGNMVRYSMFADLLNLDPGTYYIQAAAENRIGWGGWSNTASGTITATGVTGKVYQDLNNNLTLDRGEPGVPGRTVITVNLANHADVTRTITDSNGDYTSELVAGSYLVQIEGGGPNGYKYVTIPEGTMLVLNLIP